MEQVQVDLPPLTNRAVVEIQKKTCKLRFAMRCPETSEHDLSSLENLELYGAECHVFAIVIVIVHLQRKL